VKNSCPCPRPIPLAVLVLHLVLLPAFWALAEEYRNPSDGIQSMRFEGGLLSLQTKDAPLDKLLSELARVAMLNVVSDGPLEGRVTVYLEGLPLDKAFRKILRGKGMSFVYAAKGAASPKEYRLEEVRVYVAKGDTGEGRRYSYASAPAERAANASPSRRMQPRSPPASTAPRPPEMGSREDAERLFSDLMEGNLDGLNEIAEKLKEQNPQAQEQIEAFLQSLEQARVRAEESGEAIAPPEGLRNIQMLMQQLYRGSRPPEAGEPQE
jgi:hypothetical protein